ncbi:MAG: hypothetical protein ACR2F6_14670 [Mycobacteriales bacterium]
MQRPEPHQSATGTTRTRRKNHKQRIVTEREYLDLKLNVEEVAEFDYVRMEFRRFLTGIILIPPRSSGQTGPTQSRVAP